MTNLSTGVARHALAERDDDFYASPPEAVASLLAIEERHLPKSGRIWEPACGDGAITLPFRAVGFDVLATDLVERGCPDSTSRVDFLMESSCPPDVAAVVTNPPFKLAREFVDKALSFNNVRYVAMLLRLAFIEGSERKPWFESSPLARVHVASRRLPMMHRGGWDGPKAGSAVCFAWFVWDRLHDGAPTIAWFDWRDYPVSSRIAATAAANDNRCTETVDLEEYLAGTNAA